jgi:hypothetical protein
MLGSGRASCSPLPPAGVPEPKALALGFQDVAAVGEAVEAGWPGLEILIQRI